MKFKSSKIILTVALLANLLLAGCGKSVTQGRRANGTGSDKGSVDVPKGSNCETGDRSRWRWFQPEVSKSKGVDLLFVVDSSLSLTPERRKVAKAISSFLETLPADADTRIAVLLGHGENSPWSGKLYSRGSDPRVILPNALPRDRAEELLTHSLSCPAMDFGVGNGEMLLSSLQASLKDESFAEIQSQGFYRPDALLGVVFLTDENDVCFDPRAHGYTRHPDYKSSILGLEDIAYRKFCLDSAGALKVSSTSVIQGLRDRFPGKFIAMAGIVYSNPANVPYLGEDSIGHGIIELVEENATSQPSGPMPATILDLKTGDFAPALNKLATMVSSQLTLKTEFPLVGTVEVDEETLLVTVDGVEVPATYNANSRTITIPGTSVGGAGSQIDVSACSK